MHSAGTHNDTIAVHKSRATTTVRRATAFRGTGLCQPTHNMAEQRCDMGSDRQQAYRASCWPRLVMAVGPCQAHARLHHTTASARRAAKPRDGRNSCLSGTTNAVRTNTCPFTDESMTSALQARNTWCRGRATYVARRKVRHQHQHQPQRHCGTTTNRQCHGSSPPVGALRPLSISQPTKAPPGEMHKPQRQARHGDRPHITTVTPGAHRAVGDSFMC